MTRLEAVRLESRAFKADPFPFYRQLRADKPIAKVRLPMLGETWIVARHADVAALLKDARLVKDRANAAAPGKKLRQPALMRLLAPLMNGMLDKDDPDHARLRRLVKVAFTPKRIDAMQAAVETLAETLLDQLKGSRTFDLMEDYALRLPITVISDILGVPESDRAAFAGWSKALITLTQSPWTTLTGLPRVFAFMRYVRRLIADRRREPTDDLVSALVAAQDNGQSLSDDELLSMIILLLTAGHETTTNLIGNGTVALLQNPSEMERLKSEPTLIDTAIEEMLRFACPIETSTFRFAGEDLELAGMPVKRGEPVLGLIASANRDEQVFTASEAMNIGRDPNRHLTFGMGGHYCPRRAACPLKGASPSPHCFAPVPGPSAEEPEHRAQLEAQHRAARA